MKLNLINAKLVFQSVAERVEKYVTNLDGTIEFDGNYTKTYSSDKSSFNVFSIVGLIGTKIEYGKEYNVELDFECDGEDLNSVALVRTTNSGVCSYRKYAESINITGSKCTGNLKATFKFDIADGDTEKLFSILVKCENAVAKRKIKIDHVKIYYMGYE